MDSILQHTKVALGISEDDPSFDVEILMHINNALSTLNDLGVGPQEGFVVEGEDEVWEDFFPLPSDPAKLQLARPMLSKVRTYIYLKTKMIFDPPVNNPSLSTAIQGQITETEWRLNANRESTDWENPNPPVPVGEEEA